MCLQVKVPCTLEGKGLDSRNYINKMHGKYFSVNELAKYLKRQMVGWNYETEIKNLQQLACLHHH